MLVRVLVEAVERAGASSQALLAPSNIDRSRLERVDERFELAEFARLQERAAVLTGDPALGLNMGQHTTETALDSIAYLAGHAPTLREAVGAIARFAALALDGVHLTLRDSTELAMIHYAFPRTTPISDRMHSEFVMVGVLRLLRHIGGPNVRARIVSFEHGRPAYHEAYARLFASAERFDQSSTFIAFDRELADLQQLHVSPELYSVVRADAERKLGRISGKIGLTERLRRYLLAHHVARMPGMARAARDMGMSERSLRRYLAAEGTSYREIVRAQLEAFAGSMLRDSDRTIQEAAAALGFVDARTFHRAFKSWTGMTPKQYRLVNPRHVEASGEERRAPAKSRPS